MNLKIALLPVVVLGIAACGGNGSLDVESKAAGLSASYVSGHLGTERECPATTAKSSLRADARALCTNGQGGASACPPDPCENGAVLVQIRNIVDHEVAPRVQKIEVLDSTVTTPIDVALVEAATSDGHTVDKLEVGAQVTLRILFPAQMRYQASSMTGKVRITISGDGEHTFEITTPDLAFLPAIAT